MIISKFKNLTQFTFEDPRDAEEAQYRMNRQRLFGKEIEVEFARGERKSKFFVFVSLFKTNLFS